MSEHLVAYPVSLELGVLGGRKIWGLLFDTADGSRRFAVVKGHVRWFGTLDAAAGAATSLLDPAVIFDASLGDDPHYCCDLDALVWSVDDRSPVQAEGDLLDSLDLLDDMLRTVAELSQGQCLGLCADRVRRDLDPMARVLFEGGDLAAAATASGGFDAVRDALDRSVGVVLASSAVDDGVLDAALALPAPVESDFGIEDALRGIGRTFNANPHRG